MPKDPTELPAMPCSPAVLLLRELIAHLAYDAGVNGSKFTERPYGSIALSTAKPDHLFARMLGAAGVSTVDEDEDMPYAPMMDAIKSRMSQENI